MGRILRALLVAGVGVAVAVPAAALGKEFEVTRRGDPSPGRCKPRDCSLREAIIAANDREGRDRVLLPNRERPYRLARTGLEPDFMDDAVGDLDILGPLGIVHRGRGRATVDARGVGRVFETYAKAAFSKLVVRGGDPGSELGGGIAAGEPVRITRTKVVGNDAGSGGGGLFLSAGGKVARSVIRGNHSDTIAGGIRANHTDPETLTITRTKIVGNRAETDAGGIKLDSRPSHSVIKRSIIRNNRAGVDGGGIGAFGDLTLSRSTVAGNTAGQAGGGIQVVFSAAFGTVNLLASTVSGNRALGDDGGGIHNLGILIATNSTIAGNASELAGGGIYSASAQNSRLNAVTIARNTADLEDVGDEVGGGIRQEGQGVLTLDNSLIALNRNGSDNPETDCSTGNGGHINSGGGNLIGTISEAEDCEFLPGSTDFLNANPRLGRLKRNGGPTETIALRRGSPAINKAGGDAPGRDQRGVKRKNPDIGAYERR